MGEFGRLVRYNKTPGPNQRKFDRALWEKAAAATDADADDRDLARTGLHFDDLLRSIRREIHLNEIDLTPGVLARLVTAVANAGLLQVDRLARDSRRPKEVAIHRVLQQTLEVRGNQFTPDELLTGLGDGLKFVLRDLAAMTSQDTGRTYADLTDADVARANQELNIAVLYQAAVEMWLDCVGNNYRLQPRSDGLALVPRDWDLESARSVSTYRRMNLAVQDSSAFIEHWMHRLSKPQKLRLMGIGVARRTYGVNEITRIDVGHADPADLSSANAAGTKLYIQQRYYREFLDQPLDKIDGLTLLQLIDAWRFLQSVSNRLFEERRRRPSPESAKEILAMAPRIRTGILVAALTRSMKIESALASRLVNFFIFRGRDDQEVWTQPLIWIGADEVCIVLPCIHSIHLTRVLERWMRQGGLDLDRRGAEFERYCVSELQESVSTSRLRGRAHAMPTSVTFSTPQRREEIDLVLFLDDVVLLLEAKCTLWPDDCLQYANHRDTIEGAVEQIERKYRAVVNHYPHFQARIKELGVTAPDSPKILRGVVTNSAVYAGFLFSGVPVMDVEILTKYFDGALSKLEMREAGEVKFRHEIRFYDSVDEAASKLEQYLTRPPQIEDPRQSVVRREIVFPAETDDGGKLYYATCHVEIDERDIFRRLGIDPPEQFRQ